MKSHWLALVCAGMLLAAVAGSADVASPALGKAPSEAESTAEIKAAVQKIKGYGLPSWAEFSIHDGRVRHFVIWYDPFSGRAAVFVHSYRSDGKRWKLLDSSVFDNTSTISVIADTAKRRFVYRGTKGQELLTIPFEKTEK